jgi:hypothetical protein
MNPELKIKTFITDIESKLDKNSNPFFKLTLQGTPDYFYAFNNNLPPDTLTTLKETPFNFINRQVLISYEEIPNRDSGGVFRKVKAIEVL